MGPLYSGGRDKSCPKTNLHWEENPLLHSPSPVASVASSRRPRRNVQGSGDPQGVPGESSEISVTPIDGTMFLEPRLNEKGSRPSSDVSNSTLKLDQSKLASAGRARRDEGLSWGDNV